MPLFHTRKRTAQKYLNFTQSSLEKAMEEVGGEKLSTREAATQYGVPRSMLHSTDLQIQTMQTQKEPQSYHRAQKILLLSNNDNV